LLVPFVLAEAAAWLAIYRLWNWYLHGKPLSSVIQVTRLLLWLVIVVVVVYCTFVLLRFYYEEVVSS
jgi:hypothetical protein